MYLVVIKRLQVSQILGRHIQFRTFMKRLGNQARPTFPDKRLAPVSSAEPAVLLRGIIGTVGFHVVRLDEEQPTTNPSSIETDATEYFR